MCGYTHFTLKYVGFAVNSTLYIFIKVHNYCIACFPVLPNAQMSIFPGTGGLLPGTVVPCQTLGCS